MIYTDFDMYSKEAYQLNLEQSYEWDLRDEIQTRYGYILIFVKMQEEIKWKY